MHFTWVLKYTLVGTTIAGLSMAPVAAAPTPAPLQLHAPSPLQPVLGQKVTSKVVNLLKDASDACGRVDTEYRVDCLRQGLRTARAEIQRRPDYSAVAKELGKAERALNKLVKANEDRAAPKIRVRGKTVRAVKKAAAPKVAAAATKVITESATRLLRSSGTAERQAQYTQIARAVDSTKVILRS